MKGSLRQSGRVFRSGAFRWVLKDFNRQRSGEDIKAYQADDQEQLKVQEEIRQACSNFICKQLLRATWIFRGHLESEEINVNGKHLL